LFRERHNTSAFSEITSFSLGRTQQKTEQVHIEDSVQRMQAGPNRAQRANNWSCIFQQWHLCRLGCDYQPNSYHKLRRGEVITHTLVRDQHPQWTVMI